MVEGIERRRSPRIELQADEVLRLEMRHRVQVLDISQSGVLLGTGTVVPVGSRGKLRAALVSAPFCAEIDVKRHKGRNAKGQYGLGAQFTVMDDRSRHSLDSFLKRGKD